jgi:hypothetical protein
MILDAQISSRLFEALRNWLLGPLRHLYDPLRHLYDFYDTFTTFMTPLRPLRRLYDLRMLLGEA